MMDMKDTCVMCLNAIQHAIKNMENVWKERVQIFAFVILAGRVKLVMTAVLIGIAQKRMKQQLVSFPMSVDVQIT